jgi:hypothetical protein
MFEALVVSVVALGAKGTPLVLVQRMLGIEIEQSPAMLNPPKFPLLLY